MERHLDEITNAKHRRGKSTQGGALFLKGGTWPSVDRTKQHEAALRFRFLCKPDRRGGHRLSGVARPLQRSAAVRLRGHIKPQRVGILLKAFEVVDGKIFI